MKGPNIFHKNSVYAPKISQYLAKFQTIETWIETMEYNYRKFIYIRYITEYISKILEKLTSLRNYEDLKIIE